MSEESNQCARPAPGAGLRALTAVAAPAAGLATMPAQLRLILIDLDLQADLAD